jgi:tetratricopeptide (TPR) repeat protein
MQYAEAYWSRGVAWSWKGEYDKAIEDYSEAIRINPEHATAYNNRGVAWSWKGEYDKAIVDCTEAIRLDPQCLAAQRNLDCFWEAIKAEQDPKPQDIKDKLASKAEQDDAESDCTAPIAFGPPHVAPLNNGGNNGGGTSAKNWVIASLSAFLVAACLTLILGTGREVIRESNKAAPEQPTPTPLAQQTTKRAPQTAKLLVDK